MANGGLDHIIGNFNCMTDSSFDKIKKLVRITGGKIIIIEDNKPTMVIIDINEYIDNLKSTEKSASGNLSKSDILSERELIEKINKDINIWKDRQEERRLKQMEMESEHRSRNSSGSSENGKDNSEIVVERL